MKRRILLFAVIAAMMFSIPCAKAANGPKQVTIVFSNIKLVIDGKQITIQNDEGEIVEPFMMDKVVYIPVRVLSDVLGKQGKYDSKNVTYKIEKPTTNPIKWVALYDRPYISVSNANRFRAKQDKGIQYLGGNVATWSEIAGGRYQGTWDVTYALNGAAQKVSGTICKTPDYWGKYEAVYEFYDNNNKLLYKSPTMTSNIGETKFEFNTGKATNIKLKITLTSGSSSASTDCYIKDINIYTTDYKN